MDKFITTGAFVVSEEVAASMQKLRTRVVDATITNSISQEDKAATDQSNPASAVLLNLLAELDGLIKIGRLFSEQIPKLRKIVNKELDHTSPLSRGLARIKNAFEPFK